jgi:hypothetical protein
MTFFIPNAAGSATSGDGRAKGRAGSSRKWPMIVVGMLVAHASLWVGAVFIARSNATFAVEPDYYQKALHWDETAAQAAENRRLGWGMTWELSAAGGADQTRRVTATLVNRDGRRGVQPSAGSGATAVFADAGGRREVFGRHHGDAAGRVGVSRGGATRPGDVYVDAAVDGGVTAAAEVREALGTEAQRYR